MCLVFQNSMNMKATPIQMSGFNKNICPLPLLATFLQVWACIFLRLSWSMYYVQYSCERFPGCRVLGYLTGMLGLKSDRSCLQGAHGSPVGGRTLGVDCTRMLSSMLCGPNASVWPSLVHVVVCSHPTAQFCLQASEGCPG